MKVLLQKDGLDQGVDKHQGRIQIPTPQGLSLVTSKTYQQAEIERMNNVMFQYKDNLS